MLEDTTAEFTSPMPLPDNPRSQTLAQALNRDPLGMARDIGNTIRLSQLHRTRFREMIEDGNAEGRWKLPDGTSYAILVYVPLRNITLGWGSLFIMSNRFLDLRQVSIIL